MEKVFKTEKGKNLVFDRYKEILAAWPVDNKQYYIKTSIGSTFIVESGEFCNAPLILLHGGTSNSFTWFTDVVELSKQYHVFAIDLIGEAGFSEEIRPPYRSGAYELWLKEVLSELNIPSCNIVGISLGGWMALNFSVHYPEIVKGLFLISAGGLSKVNSDFLWKIFIYSLLGRRDKIFKFLNGGNNTLETPDLKSALEFSELISIHSLPRKEELPVFSSQELSNLTMPVLLVMGEKDCFFSSNKSIQQLKKSVPQAQIVLLSDSGHIIVNQAQRMIDFFGINGIKSIG